jgi:hypothetical protein
MKSTFICLLLIEAGHIFKTKKLDLSINCMREVAELSKLAIFSGCDYNFHADCMWNRDSPVSVVSLHWWPRRDWSFLWPRLRWASSRTITRPSYWQCDNPTWSHTALLSRFHARCRSPFWLHNRQSRLLGGSPVESLQSQHTLQTICGSVHYSLESLGGIG